MMRNMPSPDEIAEMALACARDAVDRLVDLIGTGEPWADRLAEPELALAELTRRDQDTRSQRETWEGHAALELVFAARTVLAPYPEADDDGTP
jgi:hypothetical protein